MYERQPKKMLIINILDILKRYTDEEHRLSQKEIMDILEQEYDMKVERKAIKRNLLNLIDYGYSIEYSESIRINRKGEEEMKKENHEIICVKLRNSKNTETCILECYGYEHAKKTIENQIEVIKDDWHVVIDSPTVEQIVSELYYESDQYKTGKAMDIFKNYCETKIKEFEPYLYTDEYGNSRKAEVLLEYSYFRGYKDGLIVDAPEIIDSQDGIAYTAKNSNMIPIDCSMITFVELVKQMDFKYISDKCYENILEYWDEIFMTEILEMNNDEIQDENEVEL